MAGVDNDVADALSRAHISNKDFEIADATICALDLSMVSPCVSRPIRLNHISSRRENHDISECT